MKARNISSILWAVNLASIAACTISYVYLAYYVLINTEKVLLSDIVLVTPMVVPILLYSGIKRLANLASPKSIILLCNIGIVIAATITYLLLPTVPLVAIAGGLVIGYFDATQRVSRTVAIKNYLSDDDVRYAVPLTLTAQFIAGSIAGAAIAFFKASTSPSIMMYTTQVLILISTIAAFALPKLSVPSTPENQNAKNYKVKDIIKGNRVLTRALISSVVFISVFQGFFNVSRVVLPAHELKLTEEFVGYIQIISSSAALIAALLYYFYSKAGKRIDYNSMRVVNFISLFCMTAAVITQNVLISFTLYFFYMFLWEIIFFEYETEVVNNCESRFMPTISAFQYAGSYIGIVAAILIGGLIAEQFGLAVTAMVFTGFYTLIMAYEYLYDRESAQLELATNASE